MDVGNNKSQCFPMMRYIWVIAILCVLLTLYAPVWAGTANYTYDSLGRITQVVYTDGVITTTITYQYDAMGNRTSVVTTRSP